MSETWVFLDDLDRIPTPSVRQIPIDFRKAWVVRTAMSLRAFYSTCTHMGGPLSPKDGRFECHFHGATFELETGRALTAPAPSGSCLPEVPMKIEDGKVYYLRVRNE